MMRMKSTTRIAHSLLVLSLLLSVSDLYAQRSTRPSLKKEEKKTDKEVDPNAPQEMRIARVISLLRDEANKIYLTYRRDGKNKRIPWTHLEPNFSKRQFVTADSAAVLKTLSRRLHENAPVDAYIRLHLLSFEPNVTFGSDYVASVRRILATLPAIQHVPEPVPSPPKDSFSVRSSTQRYIKKEVPIPGTKLRSPVIFKVDTPGKLGIRQLRQGSDKSAAEEALYKLTAKARSMNERLAEETAHAAFHNQPVIAYRDHLTDHFSDINIQFTLMLLDCRDRILAGHESINAAAQKLHDMIEEVTSQNGLTPVQKLKWRTQVQKLKDLEKAVPIAIEMEDYRLYVQRKAVRFPKETYDAILMLLRK